MENNDSKPDKRLFRRKAVILGIGIIFILFIKSCVCDFYAIPTESMKDALLPGDYVIISRLSWFAGSPPRLPILGISLANPPRLWFKAIRRGDIVAFDFATPSEPGRYLVKRVAGVPGDTLVSLGGEVMQESGSNMRLINCSYSPGGNAQLFGNIIVVPKKGDTLHLDLPGLIRWQDFIRGEGNKLEARNDKIYINGNERNTYIVKHNYFFVLGDNRKHSFDSRHWGLLPDSRIAGRPVIIYWSHGPDSTGKAASTRFDRLFKPVR